MSAPAYSLLQVQGPDAKRFLQGQVTCNLDDLKENGSLLGAHCNPAGRVLFLFRLFEMNENYYLLLPQSMLEKALSLLEKYARFFKLKLEARSDQDKALEERAKQEWTYFDPKQKHPQIYPETSARFLPHDLDLDKLDALSWNKGCYTGQEIIARMHYRGKPKYHLYTAMLKSKVLPQVGWELFDLSGPEPKAIASIVDFVEDKAEHYYLLVVAREEDLTICPLSLNGEPIEALSWLL